MLVSPKSPWAGIRAVLALLFATTVVSCASAEKNPAWNPDASAPRSPQASWIPKTEELPPQSLDELLSLPTLLEEKIPPSEIPSKATASGILRQLGEGLPPSSEEEPLELAELVDIALSKNPRTRESWQRARAAAAELGDRMSEYYPEISFDAGGGAVKFPMEFPDGTALVRQVQIVPELQITYVLMDFGRRTAKAEAAKRMLEAANYAFNREIQRVIYDVQASFYQLDAARALELAALRNLELAETVREDVGERLELGLSTRPDYLLAKQVEAQSVYDLESARTGVFNARAKLALVMGLPANAPIHVESLFEQPLPPELDAEVQEMIDISLALRPDIQAQVSRLRASEAKIAKAKADFFPTIGLEGSYGVNWWSYGISGADGTASSSHRRHNLDTIYEALVVIEWPLFEGFGRFNRLRKARAEHREHAARLRELELMATNQVWSVYYDYVTAYRKYEYGVALLEASQEAYEATSESYSVGLSTIDELLRAERDLASARYTLIGSRASLLATSAELAFAIGEVTAGPNPTR